MYIFYFTFKKKFILIFLINFLNLKYFFLFKKKNLFFFYLKKNF